ncbi:MAG TPA: hypothetical protein VGK32_17625 [Vicinamibacterales bacterium]|jgi:hypothetical protein
MQPQVTEPASLVFLTPTVARGILDIAGQARAASGGLPFQAARLFRIMLELRYPRPDPIVWTEPRVAEFFAVELYSPTGWYITQLTDALMKAADLSGVPAQNGIVVSVKPKTLTAPSILKIVLSQGDKSLDSLSDELRVNELTNGFGVKFQRRFGQVCFDVTKIDVSRSAMIVLIAEDGSNVPWSLSAGVMGLLR